MGAHLELPRAGLDRRVHGVEDLLMVVLDTVLHQLQLLPERLDELVVLLQLLVCLPNQILPSSTIYLHQVQMPYCVAGALRRVLGELVKLLDVLS